jgi:hypothetical protein
MRYALIAALCLAVTGCMSFNSMQTARTMGKGKFEVELEPSVVADTRGGVGAQGNVSARGGVSDGIDIGGRLGMAGVQIEPKFSLTSPSSHFFHLSLAPSLTYNFFTNGGPHSQLTPAPSEVAPVGEPFNLQLPLLIGFETGGGSEIVLSPRVAMPFAANGVALFAGGSIGYRIQIGKVFRLHPEVGVLFPVAGAQRDFPPVIQGGLGFALGN